MSGVLEEEEAEKQSFAATKHFLEQINIYFNTTNSAIILATTMGPFQFSWRSFMFDINNGLVRVKMFLDLDFCDEWMKVGIKVSVFSEQFLYASPEEEGVSELAVVKYKAPTAWWWPSVFETSLNCTATLKSDNW